VSRTDEPYEFDESKPEEYCIPPGTRRVWFGNPDRAPVDEQKLRDVILAQRARRSVDGILIHWGSQLTRPWVAALFPKVHQVVLYGGCLEDLGGLEQVPGLDDLQIDTGRSSRRSLALLPALRLKSLILRIAKVRDVEFLAQCQPLEWLGFSGWPFPEVSAIGALRACGMSIRAGSAVALAGLNCQRLGRLQLMGCPKLQRVAGIRVPYIMVSSCNHLELETFGEVEGLETLWLMGRKDLPSFGFLRRCTSLESFTVDNSRITATDWDSIINHPSLRHVSICRGVPDSAVERMASANPRLGVTNGSVYFFRGERVSTQDWFLLVRERNRPMADVESEGG